MGTTIERGRIIVFNFIVALSLVDFPNMSVSENACPYPCYPPPIGGGFTTQPPPTAPYNPSGGGSASTGYYPPPIENLPNYPSPPYDGDGDGGSGSFYGPPPPDPILPYFPFYYRKPPHQITDQPSSSPTSVKSTVLIVAVLANVAVMAFRLGNGWFTSY